MVELNFATPMPFMKERIDSGVYPRRRMPESVGNRGSSHPSTCPSSMRVLKLLLLITV